MPHHRAMGATTRRPLPVLAGIVLSALALRPQIGAGAGGALAVSLADALGG
jgi:hypothetical protein